MSSLKHEDQLPLFRSPLHDPEAESISHISTHESYASRSSYTKGPTDAETEYSTSQSQDEKPQIFRRFHETTNSELFYDLFFVANLTVFTSEHEVNDTTTFKQYLGFFAILWLTWYQVSLYDIRFSMDSVVDRIAKALQFGVMIGFAVVGVQFDVGVSSKDDTSDNFNSTAKVLAAFSLILMVSRLVLVVEYAQTLFFTKSKHKDAITPLAALTALYTTVSIVYLGVYFSFTPGAGKNRGYIAFYIVGLAETIIATFISSYWRVVSFKRTHLVQRMSLLTLIFLGEGIIGTARSTASILRQPIFRASPVVIGSIISLVLVLYFLYMLYFDWIEEKHFGTIRQQIWAFLHFPLHLCLVVAVEGATQVMQWTAAVDTLNNLSIQLDAADLWDTTDAAVSVAIDQLNETATLIGDAALERANTAEAVVSWLVQHNATANSFITLANNSATDNDRNLAFEVISVTLFNQIFQAAGFDPPEDKRELSANTTSISVAQNSYLAIQAITDVFLLVYIYFFISIGLVVILYGVIAWLGKADKKALHWVRLAINVVCGVAITLISAAASTAHNDDDSLVSTSYDNFVSSPMLLPTVCLILFLAVVLNNINFLRLRIPGVSKLGKRRRNVTKA